MDSPVKRTGSIFRGCLSTPSSPELDRIFSVPTGTNRPAGRQQASSRMQGRGRQAPELGDGGGCHQWTGDGATRWHLPWSLSFPDAPHKTLMYQGHMPRWEGSAQDNEGWTACLLLEQASRPGSRNRRLCPFPLAVAHFPSFQPPKGHLSSLTVCSLYPS